MTNYKENTKNMSKKIQRLQDELKNLDRDKYLLK